jgi:chromosomal replication initiation ATPase DnaA
LAPTISANKFAVCQCYAVEPGEREQSKRGQENEPRNVAVYLARKKSGLRLTDICQEFQLLKYSSVSSIVTRTEKQLLKNKQLKKRIKEINLKIDKSQAKICPPSSSKQRVL